MSQTFWSLPCKWIGIISLITLLVACGGGGGGGGTEPTPQPEPEAQPQNTAGLSARPNNTSCIAPADPGTSPASIAFIDPFLSLPDLSFPVGLFQLPGNDDFFYAIQLFGQVLRFDNDPNASQLTSVLDISAKIDLLGSEGGLLGLAFHPDVANNRTVYLSYTTGTSVGNGDNRSVISKFNLSADFSNIDPASEQVILELVQPFGNHNGGNIAFGPDGFLYIGFGDGGGGASQRIEAQNTSNFYGAMLRIDVDPNATSQPFYQIPSDNPFFGDNSKAQEIYAFGLRNPFRWSFDNSTSILWLGDVGQVTREEVDQISKNGNYGWPITEGFVCFPETANCTPSDFDQPIEDYGRDEGSSVIGGFVYRGSEVPGLIGRYIFGDFVSRNIWTISTTETGFIRDLVATTNQIVSFGQDNAGEVYLLFADNGRISKVQTASAEPSTSSIAQQLSATGCFDSSDPRQPSSAMIRFDVISPLWSDGASKQRFMALPNQQTITIDERGDLDFPVGTVLAKHFANNDIMIETRLLMLHQSGWTGYSYEWNSAQTDASLLTGAKDTNVAGLNYHFPNSAECIQCHSQVKNFALAPEVLQLNSDFLYPSSGITANQIDTLNQIGVFTAAANADLADAKLFALDDNNASLEQRAKSYLHSNCSQCHQPGASGGGVFDFRFETALAQMNICNIAPLDDLQIDQAKLLAPGSPAQSVILQRILSLDNNRMPPLATNLVDQAAATVISDWISSLSSCP